MQETLAKSFHSNTQNFRELTPVSGSDAFEAEQTFRGLLEHPNRSGAVVKRLRRELIDFHVESLGSMLQVHIAKSNSLEKAFSDTSTVDSLLGVYLQEHFVRPATELALEKERKLHLPAYSTNVPPEHLTQALEILRMVMAELKRIDARLHSLVLIRAPLLVFPYHRIFNERGRLSRNSRGYMTALVESLIVTARSLNCRSHELLGLVRSPHFNALQLIGFSEINQLTGHLDSIKDMLLASTAIEFGLREEQWQKQQQKNKNQSKKQQEEAKNKTRVKPSIGERVMLELVCFVLRIRARVFYSNVADELAMQISQIEAASLVVLDFGADSYDEEGPRGSVYQQLDTLWDKRRAALVAGKKKKRLSVVSKSKVSSAMNGVGGLNHGGASDEGLSNGTIANSDSENSEDTEDKAQSEEISTEKKRDHAAEFRYLLFIERVMFHLSELHVKLETLAPQANVDYTTDELVQRLQTVITKLYESAEHSFPIPCPLEDPLLVSNISSGEGKPEVSTNPESLVSRSKQVLVDTLNSYLDDHIKRIETLWSEVVKQFQEFPLVERELISTVALEIIFEMHLFAAENPYEMLKEAKTEKLENKVIFPAWLGPSIAARMKATNHRCYVDLLRRKPSLFYSSTDLGNIYEEATVSRAEYLSSFTEEFKNRLSKYPPEEFPSLYQSFIVGVKSPYLDFLESESYSLESYIDNLFELDFDQAAMWPAKLRRSALRVWAKERDDVFLDAFSELLSQTLE